MNKLLSLINFLCILVFLPSIFSCSDNTLDGSSALDQITFEVFECNEPFSVESSASARFVSEDALITIWDKDGDDFYPIKVLKTKADGTVQYGHNYQDIYYSVSKDITDKDGRIITKQNLYILTLNDPELESVKYLNFQIDGLFTSEEDIAEHARFNISPELVKYIPHVGAVKLKDLNDDGLIDENDAIAISSIDPFEKDKEVVYLSRLTTK